MPSVWVARRPRAAGGTSYRVMFRIGGRESAPRYGGAFPTMREAQIRKQWVGGELAAMRVPDLAALERPAVTAETFRRAAEAWRSTRIDVAESTRVLHRVALERAMPLLGERAVDQIGIGDLAELVAELAAAGKKRETIRKTVKYTLAVLGRAGVAFSEEQRKQIRLPHEEQEEIIPPTAAHVEAVYRLLPSAYRLALLWLDWSGARVASIDTLTIGDYDEQERRVRLRASTTKTRRALWVELHQAFADQLEAALPARDDRDLAAPLFPDVGSDRLRTSIARACKAAGVPLFSPHDLRHRRISLLHAQGRTWAEIGRFVGQKKLSITADTYTHVLLDARELDYAAMRADR